MTGGRDHVIGRGEPRSGAAALARPWLRQSPFPASPARIRRWRLALDTGRDEVTGWRHDAVYPGRGLAAGISVIVVAGGAGAAHPGLGGPGVGERATPGVGAVGEHTGLEACLRSLICQTLEPELYEIVLVVDGAVTVRAVVDELRGKQPRLRLRVVRLAEACPGAARDVGIAAATRQYVTFVDGADSVSEPFLATLLAYAEPTVVPVVPAIEVAAGQRPCSGTGSVPTGREGELFMAAEVPSVTADGFGKAFATDLLKDLVRDAGACCWDPVVFWTAVVVRGHVVFWPCPGALGAAYHRSMRRGSVAPPRGDQMPPDLARRLATVVDLDRLANVADAAGLDIVRRHADAQLAVVGDRLAADPAQHEHAVAALDRGPVLHLPLGRMNASLGNGLVIAYAFAPYGDTSAVVAAKRLRARGQVADVVSNAMDEMRPLDATVNAISGPYVRRLAALPTPSHFSRWPALEQFALTGLETIQRWVSDGARYEWLYSRAHFAASHLLAAAYKLAEPDIRWSAEFSDPLSRDIADQERGAPIGPGRLVDTLRAGMANLGLPVPASANSLVWCEELTYALADELVFTNEAQLEHMLGYCASRDLAALARGKAVVSPHPTLPAEFYSMVRPDYPLEAGAVHLAYFGKFYANRGFDDVLAAIARQDRASRSRLRVHIFTRKPAALRRRAAELGVTQCVRVGPYVRYLEFLNLLTRFDCLLVTDAATAQSHGRNPYLPSKWSDYRGSGTPVWGLVEAGSPLSRQPLDYLSPVGDVAAASEVIAALLNVAPAASGARFPSRSI